MSSFNVFVITICTLACQVAYASTAGPECKRFDAIYQNGKELCENMWDGAFAYETDEAKSYTMWFFDKLNPNNAVAQSLNKLGSSGHDTCNLNYFHKEKVGPEPDAFTECHPWKDEACCSHGTVETETKLKEGYGTGYHWDRCGPLSQECERFFVQEACFYECDPNAGLYRKFPKAIYNASNEDHNEWQMHKMPIKASYCDAWFTACRKDKFCASDGGSYFSCAAEYEKVDAQMVALQTQLAEANSKTDTMQTEYIVAFIAGGVLIFGLCITGCIIIKKEKAGKPLFGKLLDVSPGPAAQTYDGEKAIGNTGI
jgi:folate receptor